jgi:hypothetical protein
VIREHDGLDRPGARCIRLMTHRADSSRVRRARGNGWIGRMCAERSVTRFAADARVCVGLARVGHVGMTVDARQLSRVDSGLRRDLRQRARAIVPEPAVVSGNEQGAQYREHEDACREHSGQAKQVFVGAEWRHNAAMGKPGACRGHASCGEFRRETGRRVDFSTETRKITQPPRGT